MPNGNNYILYLCMAFAWYLQFLDISKDNLEGISREVCVN
jgi:hypothetical protein